MTHPTAADEKTQDGMRVVALAMPEEMDAEMQAAWKGAWTAQAHKRHGRGIAGDKRRLKNPTSAEQAAWSAVRGLLKYRAQAAPAAASGITGDQLHEIMCSFEERADVSEIAAKINAALSLPNGGGPVAHPLHVGKEIELRGHRWVVEGIHLGAEGQESLIQLKGLSHQPGWTGPWEFHPMLFVPEVMLSAALSASAKGGVDE